MKSKSHIVWHKITPKRLPPLGVKVIVYHGEMDSMIYGFVSMDYFGCVAAGWTHWGYVNLPK